MYIIVNCYTASESFPGISYCSEFVPPQLKLNCLNLKQLHFSLFLSFERFSELIIQIDIISAYLIIDHTSELCIRFQCICLVELQHVRNENKF